MRLADFILANVEPILAEWERFARSLAPGREMSVLALRDHAEEILLVTARDMVSPQSARQQSDKGKGLGGGGAESEGLDQASAEHAIERFVSGFELIEVVSEYRALRASVLRLWRDAARGAGPRDLEDLIRFNESIDQSLAQAMRSFTERLDESRELFLATLGHDLRAPLHAMMLSSEVLAMSEQLDEKNREIAAQMKGFGNVMAGMIHDLLDFTRTRLGTGIPLSPAPVDLKEVCRDVLAQFGTAHPGRPIRLECSGETGGEWDPSRLRQVLSNLVANAITHGDPREPVEVRVAGDGADVQITVTNRGPAIPPSTIPRLFNPFARAAAPADDEPQGRGVGLGLYIVRQVVTAHGGSIDVRSSDTDGTAVSIRLPRKQQDERPSGR